MVSPVGERVEEVSLARAHPLVFGAVGAVGESAEGECYRYLFATAEKR